MLTNHQEILNHVVRSLRKQGRPSAVPDEEEGGVRCLYRGPDGIRCAAGFCLPDEHYSPGYEGTSASKVFEGLLPEATRCLLDRLQGAHDEAASETVANPDDWLFEFEEKACDVAHDCDLTYPEPEA